MFQQFLERLEYDRMQCRPLQRQSFRAGLGPPRCHNIESGKGRPKPTLRNQPSHFASFFFTATFLRVT